MTMGRAERVAEARRELTLRTPHEIPATKRCSCCGKLKGRDEFSIRRVRLKTTGEIREYLRAACKECEGGYYKRWKNRKKRQGEWSAYLRERRDRELADSKRAERRREIDRERATIKRRQQGMKVRGPWSKYREQGRGGRLPIEPFSTWLSQQCVRTSVSDVAMQTGFDERHIRRLTSKLDEEGKPIRKVSLDTMDRIFIGLGHPDQMVVLYPK
jgi:hypothetical protein